MYLLYRFTIKVLRKNRFPINSNQFLAIVRNAIALSIGKRLVKNRCQAWVGEAADEAASDMKSKGLGSIYRNRIICELRSTLAKNAQYNYFAIFWP
jgi:hypothetical protein